MHLDFTINVPLLITMLTLAGGVILRMNALLRVIKDFPPHRHVNDEDVIYPTGMQPERVKHRSASV